MNIGGISTLRVAQRKLQRLLKSVNGVTSSLFDLSPTIASEDVFFPAVKH